MRFVLRQTTPECKFALFTFEGDREIALAAGYIEISEDDYLAIKAQLKCWDSEGNIVPYVKTPTHIERERIAAVKARNYERKKQIEKIQRWFEKYDTQVAEYGRAMRLGTTIALHINDEIFETISDMDARAVEKANEIKRLREEFEPVE